MIFSMDLDLKCSKCEEVYKHDSFTFVIHRKNLSRIQCSCGHNLIVFQPHKQPEEPAEELTEEKETQ